MNEEIKSSNNRKLVLLRYLLLTYLALLVNTFGYLGSITFDGALTRIFSIVVYLIYPWLYMLPLLILVSLVDHLWVKRAIIRKSWPIYMSLVLMATLIQIFIMTDRVIFGMYDFHINGFVWNIIKTPGGLESLGGSDSTTITFGLITLAILDLY